jgi:hypothetical protein
MVDCRPSRGDCNTITVERTVAITIVAQFFEITLSMILSIVAIIIAVTFLTNSLKEELAKGHHPTYMMRPA